MSSPVWHPFTQHALLPDAIAVERAEGAYLYTQDGRRLIDGISSWWVNLHGHCHPRIVAAVQAQAAQLDQIIFAGFTHAPAEKLAQKLIDITDASLTRVFFSDSGSICVEVALKMALGYWTHTGRPRHKIVALEHGYHGDTFGTMAAGARGVFNDLYAPLLFNVLRLPFPDQPQETLDAFENMLRDHKDEIAALILEPLVLGAGGMRMYPPSVLTALHALCRQHDVLLIADEVMTGWGRTGTLFACDQAGIVPDILCLSKGLTGGFLPLAVTLCREEIYQAFYSRDRQKMFFHSSSFTGNPLACAAALAALEVWEAEPVRERIAFISAYHAKALQSFAGDPRVANVRHIGTIAALDFGTERPEYLSGLGPVLYDFFLSRGLLLRPLGNTVYILPPYCVTEEDLDALYQGLADALDFIGDGSGQPEI